MFRGREAGRGVGEVAGEVLGSIKDTAYARRRGSARFMIQLDCNVYAA